MNSHAFLSGDKVKILSIRIQSARLFTAYKGGRFLLDLDLKPYIKRVDVNQAAPFNVKRNGEYMHLDVDITTAPEVFPTLTVFIEVGDGDYCC